MTDVVAPDADLLARAIHTFLNTAADASYLKSPNTLTFTALTDNTLTGWCWGYHLPRPDGSSMLYLHQLEVLESHRSQGIGRQLLTTFITTGQSLGATKMFLTTGANNTPARNLYDSMGGGLSTQGATVNYWFLL
ncbi:GNAT family N-acetyltransferase [Kribbella sp. NBC_00709]|uniref:GNAT family N-acetyltransferase n=1 Tax=Kribbella sp. NBC_00709 TaxID=2975972 RepID=UPI002E2D6404|nr:GNAT family N-acetyltransferase [Kribbella sp. NBC_00709]